MPQADKGGTAVPTKGPPNGGAAQTAQPTRPTGAPPKGNAAGAAAGQAARPRPGGPMAAGADAAATATVWQSGQQINELWSINQDRNAWMGVQNVGWKKLSTASESGTVALNVLASHARQTGSSVDYREEADGMVHELYVW
jgi:hypothetical protein